MRPTKPRIALLQAVADGAVSERYPLLPDPSYSVWDSGPGTVGNLRYHRVTGRVAEMEREGLVRLAPRDDGAHYKDPREWMLTAAGEMWLKANGGTP